MPLSEKTHRMPHQPPGLTYREAMDGLCEAHRMLSTILQGRLTRETRIQLQVLSDMLERLLARDDGRTR